VVVDDVDAYRHFLASRDSWEQGYSSEFVSATRLLRKSSWE